MRGAASIARTSGACVAAAAIALALACTSGGGAPADAGGATDAEVTRDASGAPDAYVSSTAALFEVPRGGAPPASGFYALPFPNDIRVGPDGRIDLSDHIRPNALLDLYLAIFGEWQRGFSSNAAVFFRFADAIDPDSLPSDPWSSLDADASVYLVNVDPTSARYGERTPLRFRFEPLSGEMIGANWLSVLPYPGFPLDEQTVHAAIVTTRVRAAEGGGIIRSPELDAVLGDAEPSDPDLSRAHAVYRPLREYLDAPGGDERDDVASAAVFTTQDATSLMGRLRAVVYDGFALPVPRDIVQIGSTFDYAWYDGAYDAPNFQSGEVPYRDPEDGGAILVDPLTDLPIVQRTEAMRLSFTVPTGSLPPTGWPVVLYAHGTGGDYHSFATNGTARRLARQGIATVSIDQVLHGPRNVPGGSVELSFFNIQNPLSARDNVRQAAADNFQLLRLVTSFDYTEPPPGGRTVRFDPDRIYFMGHSQGGITGPPFVAYEPAIQGAVLSGAGGLLYLAILYKEKPQPLFDLFSLFIRDVPLDEFNPMLALLQMWFDPADPVSYGPLLVRDPPPGVGPKHIFQSEGIVDRYTPNPAIHALATAIGVDLVEPVLLPFEGLELRGSEVLAPPLAGNRDGTTAALLQYPEVAGSDGHWVIFQNAAAQTQSMEFLGTLASTSEATIVAP